MRQALRIGRLFGIELRVDVSWVVILVLMIWSLPPIFFAWHPDWSPLMAFGLSVVGAVLFFTSVLLHELAHALVARGYGIPVRDITIFMFGGISSLEREPPTPMAEIAIALVGPLVSIGLGVAMMFGASALLSLSGAEITSYEQARAAVQGLGPLGTLFLWLGPINVMLGLFNLIPGFPLDGGRVLRAIVWKITGNLPTATRAAALAGQGVGWAFVVMGILMAFGYSLPIFGSGPVSGLWLALIGLFLRNVAVAHYAGASVTEALAGVRVRDLMRTKGPSVPSDLPIRRLVDEWFLARDERAYPVFDGDRFVGLVSFEDLRKVPPTEWDQRTVADVMTPAEQLAWVSPDEDVTQALRQLVASGVGQLPVIANGAFAGMLFESDVMKWLEIASAANAPPVVARPPVLRPA